MHRSSECAKRMLHPALLVQHSYMYVLPVSCYSTECSTNQDNILGAAFPCGCPVLLRATHILCGMFCCLPCRGEELDAQPLFYNDATPFTVESLTGLWSDLKATVDALSEVRLLE